MNGLTFSKTRPGLHFMTGNFRSPSHGISSVSLKKIETQVRCEQTVPLSLASSLTEEQAYRGTSEVGINGTACTSERRIVLTEFPGLKFPDDFPGSKIPVWGLVPGLSKSDHPHKVAPDVPAGNQPDKGGIGKPAVYKQVVKADTAPDGILDHPDGLVCLLHCILPDTFLNSLALVVLIEAGPELYFRKAVLPVRVLSFLAMEGKVKHQLAPAIGKQESETLIAEYALVGYMREDTADKFRLPAGLGSVSIVDDQTRRLIVVCICLAAGLSDKLQIHRVERPVPLHIAIIQKPIEHVLFTSKYISQH